MPSPSPRASSARTRLSVDRLEDRLAPATFVVTNTTDAGAGSLRWAINHSNASPGGDVIAFDIPGGGVHTITPGSRLPGVTDPVVIAGHTQHGFAGTPLIELNGSAAGAGRPGLVLAGEASGSVVRGLVVNNFGGDGLRIRADDCRIVGNYIGTDATGTAVAGNAFNGVALQSGVSGNVIGGTTVGARNVISGNGFDGVSINGPGNRVLGNFIGTTADGTAELGNGGTGVFVGGGGATGNVIGGTATGSRNVISGNDGHGVWLTGFDTSGNVVQGNYIGTTADGAAVLGNTLNGVFISYLAPNNVVGGNTAAARNVVSGNGGHGVEMFVAGTSGNRVVGNRIGTAAASGADLGNGGDGVRFANGAGGNRVGGAASGTGNVIAHNGGAGVRVGSGTGNAVLGNRIFANTGLGIDLGPVGVTPNDFDDPDVGANHLFNFPLLYDAHQFLVVVPYPGPGVITELVMRVRGSVNTETNRTVRIEFFVSPAADPSGHGEGTRFLGATTVTTGGTNTVSFNVLLPTDDLFEGQVVTATATDLGTGDTSEFSAPQTVTF
ncbi:MAG TPA: hypothetical protein VM597_39425 [Gemmataceae bacterium]|nr:hypothetical protein [Gemmataceae bacterium]